MYLSKTINKKLVILFIVKLFSTLSFSVMFSSLALYLRTTLHVSQASTSDIVGIYLALNYVLPLMGGYIGNRIIDFKKLFCIGLVCQSLGLFLLSLYALGIPAIALSFVLMGAMVNSVSIIYFVNEVAGDDHEAKRIAMLYSYTAMNIGFFTGYFFSGLIGGLFHSYSILFFILGFCPLISSGLMLCCFEYKHQLSNSKANLVKLLFILIALLVLIFCVISFAGELKKWLIYAAVLGFIYLLFCSYRLKLMSEKLNLLTFLFYSLASIGFWSVYMMIPTVLMSFISDHVNLSINGFHIAPQWLNNIDPFVLVVGSPILAYFTGKLKAKYGISLPISIYFFIGLLLIALGALALSTTIMSYHRSLLPISSIVVFMIFISFGELFVGPEGYTLAGRLAPSSLKGIATGAWLSTIGVASLISTIISDNIFSNKSSNLIMSYGAEFHKTGIIMIIIASAVLVIGYVLERTSSKKVEASHG